MVSITDTVSAIQYACAAAQTEIILFTLAVCTYQFAFGYLRLPRRKPKLQIKSVDVPSKVSSEREAGNGKTTDDLVRKVPLIKAAANKGQLTEAIAIFEACEPKLGVHFNAILDACVSCGDVAGAQRFASEAKRSGQADITTHNTLMKVYLRAGDLEGARGTVAQMRSAGFEPNCVTFNELLDASVTKNLNVAWSLVDEMIVAGIKPNRITCSILLKSVQVSAGQSHSHLEKVLQLIDKMDEKMDEILLASVIEACVRANRTDILKTYLNRQRGGRVALKSAHAYGSLIRGYGAAQDVDGVWSTWRKLRADRIELTSVTAGCMVEAIVSNSGPDEGYKLILELSSDPETKPLINAVIYGSVLKGFSHEKQFDRVWELYQAMRANGVSLTVATYNTLVDACARCGRMRHVPDLVSEMMGNGIQLNIITYSAIIKGYCQENRIDQALDVLAEMKQHSSLKPDEHTYNTVINGCARQGRFEQGISIFDEMCQAGIRPTNFTLSVLVKLASRSNRVEKAFELCDDLRRRFDLRPNVHVYNNLIQACVCHKGLSQGFEVVDRMINVKVRPDVRTYTLLLRACVDSKAPDDAAGLIRTALGMEGAHHRFAKAPRVLLQAPGGLPSELLAEIIEGVAFRSRDRVVAGKLLQELRQVLGSKLSTKLEAQLLSR